MEEDFVVFKIDIHNAFNLVSRQALLDECATFFPELLPWVTWCYGTHFHQSLECSRVIPLVHCFFLRMVLQRLISSIDADDDCLKCSIRLGILMMGSSLEGAQPLYGHCPSLKSCMGPSLGIHINLAKCELFRYYGNSMFSHAVKFLHHPNLDILGAQ